MAVLAIVLGAPVAKVMGKTKTPGCGVVNMYPTGETGRCFICIWKSGAAKDCLMVLDRSSSAGFDCCESLDRVCNCCTYSLSAFAFIRLDSIPPLLVP